MSSRRRTTLPEPRARNLPRVFAWEDFSFDFASIDGGIQGGQGLVVSAVHKSNVVYAVKVIDFARHDTVEANLGIWTAADAFDEAEAQAKNEAALATSLTHAFIVPTLGSFMHNSRMFIIMKQLVGHLALDAIIGNAGRALRSEHVLAQMSFALEHMHHIGIAHGDIKADNVLQGEGDNTALCDFGVSKHIVDVVELSRVASGERVTRIDCGRIILPRRHSSSKRRHAAIYAPRGLSGLRGA